MAPNFTGRALRRWATLNSAAYSSAPPPIASPYHGRLEGLHHLAQDVAGRQPPPAARRRAVDVAGDAAQPLDHVEEPRLAADGEVEARVAVGDDVQAGHLLLAHEAGHRVEVLLAEARIPERVLEAPPSQLLGEPLGPRVGAGDGRRQDEITRGVQHGPEWCGAGHRLSSDRATCFLDPRGGGRYSPFTVRTGCCSERHGQGKEG
jgi:hypothetical protein